MFKLNVCLLLLLLYIVVSGYGFGFRGFHYEGGQDPVINSHSRHIPEKWILQPLNHFDVRDTRSWSMRYYENNEFYNDTGLILIMLGGEWTISPSYLQTGLMYDIGRTHSAMMYYTEHRYYGKSKPVRNTKPENLQYLNVDQALVDVAYFIETKKIELDCLNNCTVIVFGGSYSGNMAAWLRLKYPHLIQGALASSAPVHAKADFTEYYEVVGDSLRIYNEQCVIDVKSAIDTVEYLLSYNGGAKFLQTQFNLCHIPNIKSTNDIGWIMNAIAEIFATAVQYNKIESNGKSTIAILCDKMINTDIKSPFDRLANIIKKSKCIDWNYHNFIKRYKNTSWNFNASTMRLWFYQTCTEYGYYQTSSSRNSTFGRLFPLELFIQICKDIYGNYYNANLLNTSVKRTNVMYGGSLPDLKNVIFINGNIDPWHALSILEDINELTPAILINGSSHTADLLPDLPTDIDELKKARQRVRAIISEWIHFGKKI